MVGVVTVKRGDLNIMGNKINIFVLFKDATLVPNLAYRGRAIQAIFSPKLPRYVGMCMYMYADRIPVKNSGIESIISAG